MVKRMSPSLGNVEADWDLVERRGRFSCREVGSGVPCTAVSGLALVINFPNELILMKLAHEKQEKNREDEVDITLEAQLGDGFSSGSKQCHFQEFLLQMGNS